MPELELPLDDGPRKMVLYAADEEQPDRQFQWPTRVQTGLEGKKNKSGYRQFAQAFDNAPEPPPFMGSAQDLSPSQCTSRLAGRMVSPSQHFNQQMTVPGDYPSCRQRWPSPLAAPYGIEALQKRKQHSEFGWMLTGTPGWLHWRARPA